MILKTKLNNHYQTTIPKYIRDKLNADEASYVEWQIDENNNQVIVRFIKKPSLLDIPKLNEVESDE